jgi:hypothetical protein
MFNFLKSRKARLAEDIARQEAELLGRIAPFRRSAWIPETCSGDGDLEASKFAGIPWLSPTETWPVCPNCGGAMQL